MKMPVMVVVVDEVGDNYDNCLGSVCLMLVLWILFIWILDHII